MKRVVVLLLGLVMLAGCQAVTAPGEPIGTGRLGVQAINYVHDVKNGVGCWFYVSENGSSISCLPDGSYIK